MGDMDFDLKIAMLKKKTGAVSEDDLYKSTKSFCERQLEQMMDKFSGFTFEQALFCDGFFSMLMPSELFGEPLVMEDVYLFQSHKEKMTMAIKAVDSEQTIDFEKIKEDYVIQMRNSKQQTKIDRSDSVQSNFGTVYFFQPSMPCQAVGCVTLLYCSRPRKK